jgi:hypothetical protein
MDSNDAKMDERDTIPCPPPSHVEDLDDSGIFTFALDCESLDED